MLGELTADNAALARSLEEAHELCEEQRDVATASLIEGWIDEVQTVCGSCARRMAGPRYDVALMASTPGIDEDVPPHPTPSAASSLQESS